VPLVGGVTAAVALALGLAAWQLTGNGAPAPPAAVAQAAPAVARVQHRPAVPATPVPAAAAAKAAPAKRSSPRPAHLLLRAARGDCWVIVRSGSASGPVLYENTLRRGKTLRIAVQRSLWMRVGLGTNLDAWVGGHALRTLPSATGNLRVGI
jgi:hypothetical protein